MSTVENTEEVDNRHFEIVDHNIAAGYVTYIVDRWEGDRDDATVGITRYIGVWHEEKLESEERGAFDPLFWPSRKTYSYRGEPDSPPPLHWSTLETVKEPDRELLKFKNDQKSLIDEHTRSYTYGSSKKRSELYNEFLYAIDKLAKHPEDEVAWATVENWRKYNARLHEK